MKRVGIDVGDRRFVVRMHRDLQDGAELVQTGDYDDVALALLEEEEERVVSSKRART